MGLFPQFRRQQQQSPPQLAPPPPPPIPIVATSIGASVDSFYRSAMNSLLNQRLTNKKSALFPNMHIQTPVRIMYLNGIKNLRVYIDQNKKRWLDNMPPQYNRRVMELGLIVTPGLVMTPFSSLLEASNAGHMNPESMSVRWTRGLVPRAAREIIFAIGLNQVSDLCEANVPADIENKQARNMLGSLTAGVLSGYLSHVPHNLSTLKLLKPQQSYGEHFNTLLTGVIDSRLDRNGAIYQSPLLRNLFGLVSVFLMPKGVVIRTTQIVGSFIIVNGAITLLSKYKIDERIKDVYGNSKPTATQPTLKA